jgi:plastocyanin
VFVLNDRDPPGMKRPRLEIAQKGRQFSPRLLVVPPGTRVDFPNKDRDTIHNVFSIEPVFFDLGRGKPQSYPFRYEGEYNIYCDIHEEMSAKVRVMPSARFARMAADGSYRLDVPVGKHKLGIWYPDAARVDRTRTIEVVEGQAVSLDIKVNTALREQEAHTRKDGSPYTKREDGRY